MPLQRRAVVVNAADVRIPSARRAVHPVSPRRVGRREGRLSRSVVHSLDLLEGRVVLAAPLAPPVPLLNPKQVPQFVNALPNPLTELTPYTPAGVDGSGFAHYDIGTAQISHDAGLGYVDPVTRVAQGVLDANGAPVKTPMFGYGNATGGFTYPGRTLQVQKGTPISVTFANNLPQQHVVPIDPTVLPPNITFVPPAAKADPTTGAIAEGIPMVPHLHGGHTDAWYDGTPLQYWTANGTLGADYKTDTFVYANDQDAATLWYHDHAMGVTRLNAYAGLAGFYLIRDARDTGVADNPATPAYDGNPMRLPAGAFEVPIAIQDKQFLSNGRLWFPASASAGQSNVASMLPEMFGDVILANGKAWPKLDVQAKRYRLRLLNGSDSRFYTMSLAQVTKTGSVTNTTLPIWQIGSDEGFLNAPVSLTQLTLGPGERADVIVDFSGIAAGTSFMLTNSARSPFPAGAKVQQGLTDRVMMFNVGAAVGADPSNPVGNLVLRPANAQIPSPTRPAPAAAKQMALYESVDGLGRILPMLGDVTTSKQFIDPNNPYDAIARGDQVWEIYNTTPDAHPIHLHLVKFQLLSRQAFTATIVPTGTAADGSQLVGIQPGTLALVGTPAPATGNEVAYKDTIQILPGQMVRVRANFDLGGKYVWHCHILSHEEHDMMRFFQVGNNPFPTPRNVYRPAAAAIAAADTGAVSTFAATRIGVDDVIGATPEDTLAGSAAADLLV